VKHETKTFTAEVKAEGDGIKAGQFVALVSVFDNVDLGGDRIVKGAFDASIKAWQDKGDPLPIIWSHEWDNPQAHIGYADPKDIRETDKGLEIKATLDTDRPFAEQVHHLLKNRRVTQFSFGYFAKDFEMVQEDEATVRELKAVEIFEAGPTLLGMNPSTELLQAASALLERQVTVEEAVAEAEAGEKAAPENKAIEVPEYVSDNAKRGLAYYEDGYGGDGLVQATIRSAREMAAGSVSEEKVRKIGPWIARHIVDLDAPQNNDSNDPDYPGAGLVAMLLWGAGPDVEGARRTQAWAEQEAARLEDSTKSETTEAESEPETEVAGDTQGTIDIERLLSLVVRTQHEENT
jgi:HK97 family phage prohead protease